MNTLAFIGGGNMASAIIGGLIQSGPRADAIVVVDPARRSATSWRRFGVRTLAAADASAGLRRAGGVGRQAAALPEAARPARLLSARRPAAQRDGRHSQRLIAAATGANASCAPCRTRRRWSARGYRACSRAPRSARRARGSRRCWRRPARCCGSIARPIWTRSPRCPARARPTSSTSSRR